MLIIWYLCFCYCIQDFSCIRIFISVVHLDFVLKQAVAAILNASFKSERTKFGFVANSYSSHLKN